MQAADGRVVGRVLDLTARVGSEHPVVHRVVVGHGRRPRYLLPWATIESYERSGVRLRDVGPLEPMAVAPGRLPLADDELLLIRDVLDTQVVDVAGHRLARVADILLTRLPDGRLELAAVDVGLRAVVRRLALARLGRRLPERAVDWRDLHLTSDRGHDVQLATKAAAVHRLDAHELAELLTRLDLDNATAVLRHVGPARAAAAVARTHPEVGGRLMLALEPEHAATVVGSLPSESAGPYQQVLRTRPRQRRARLRRWAGWRLRRPGVRAGHQHDGRGD